MLANFHTHTTFSDGKDSPENVVKYAIEQGFSALGFSDHGFTENDLRYCMKDVDGYVAEIKRLKEKYVGQIQIYLGVEEDASNLVNFLGFDYIIGSLHYINYRGKYYSFDNSRDDFSVCKELFRGDELALVEAYYKTFLEYLMKRKPDVIGHFDLLTKFEEVGDSAFLQNERYWELTERYLKQALLTGCIFEVNTGLISRGLRSTTCPHPRLLRILAQAGAKITISSDAHKKEDLATYFDETRDILRGLGYDGSYVLFDGHWQKVKF